MTSIRCTRRPGRRPCAGLIEVLRLEVPAPTEWWCPVCGEEGAVSAWEGSPFDLRRPGSHVDVQADPLPERLGAQRSRGLPRVSGTDGGSSRWSCGTRTPSTWRAQRSSSSAPTTRARSGSLPSRPGWTFVHHTGTGSEAWSSHGTATTRGIEQPDGPDLHPPWRRLELRGRTRAGLRHSQQPTLAASSLGQHRSDVPISGQVRS